LLAYGAKKKWGAENSPAMAQLGRLQGRGHMFPADNWPLYLMYSEEKTWYTIQLNNSSMSNIIKDKSVSVHGTKAYRG
jgi:hypothetical protein